MMNKFVSLAQYPGTTGTYYYTRFFEYYGISAEYSAQQCLDIRAGVESARQSGVSGISVTMPYKQTVIELLDSVTDDVKLYNSCNTIVNNSGVLTGYNSDIAGVAWSLSDVHKSADITVLGSGAMAQQYIKYLLINQYQSVTQISRQQANWNLRNRTCDVLINCTALGTVTSESPVDSVNSELVIDLSIRPADLATQCLNASVKYLSGAEFYQQQFLKQFEIYTGVTPDTTVYKLFESQR
jgi:shikimate dehydrogenase